MPGVWTDGFFKTLANRINSKIEFDGNVSGRIAVEGIERYLNIPCQSRDGASVPMDIYKPVVEHEKKLPVIMYIHGGALMLGDKRMAEGFCEVLASKGFIVCALDYRHVPDVRIYEDLADVSAGMDTAAEYIKNLGANLDRVYVAAESAGAYLAVYANAMIYSEGLHRAVGYEPAHLRFKAMALIDGMFYTRRHDKVGLLGNTYYGIDEHAMFIAPYTNPENPEIVRCLPPCLLFTSDADFLRNYSYDYNMALAMNNIEHKLINLGNDRKLTHAFPVMHPEYPESAAVADNIAKWFNKY